MKKKYTRQIKRLMLDPCDPNQQKPQHSMDHSAARSGEKAVILTKLTSRVSREPFEEDLIIEWSSSDEEVIQPTPPPVSPNETEPLASINIKEQSETYKLSAHESGINKKGEINPQKSGREQSLLNTNRSQEKKHNTKGSQGCLFSWNHSDLIKKENEGNGGETAALSALSGSNHQAMLNTIASCINILQPQSPTLGSKRIVTGSCSPIVKGRKAPLKCPSSTLISYKTPKRKLALSDSQIVKKYINNEDLSVDWTFNEFQTIRKEEQRESNSCHHVSNNFLKSDTRKRNLNEIHEAELDNCSGQPMVEQKEGTQNLYEMNFHLVPAENYRRQHTPSEYLANDVREEIIQIMDDPKTFENEPESSVCSDLCLSSPRHPCTDDDASPSISILSEGASSKLDPSIESSQRTCRISMNSTDIFEESESSGFQAASNSDLLTMDGDTRSGFDWVKNLQTPQKLMSSRNSSDGVESARKKLVKDGHAQHLNSVLASWRSCITLWSHELSLPTLLGSPLPDSPSLPSKLQHHALSTKSIVKLEPEMKISEIKSPSCSAVKNLQHLMIENPVSSPEINSRKFCRKYVDLRLLDIGGNLASNAALCEVIETSVEIFKTSIVMKTENGERVETEGCRKCLVYFALDEHNITDLQNFDIVRVYSTWQNLHISAHDIPTLFASYFKFHLREQSSLPARVRRTVLHTWTCTCSEKMTSVSLCDAELCAPLSASNSEEGSLPLGVCLGFTTIKNTPDTPPQKGKLKAGTVVEALEKCGGVSAMQVSINIRIHRTIIQREASGSVESWELLGQDAAGQFCIVKIPNWPLAQHLMETISDSATSQLTYTMTHLTITQRLTNTKNPGLFSLISSLYNAYQRSVLENPLLQPVLQNMAYCPQQTHCYVMTVNLGVTKVLSTAEQVTFPIQLPHWSLQEALQISCDGQRGSLTVYVLYKTNSSLHIVNLPSLEEGNPSFSLEIMTEIGKSQEPLSVSRILLMGASIPPRWPESGPIMLFIVLKDAVMWHGNLVADDYSTIEIKEEKSRKINLEVLNQALTPLSHLTQQDSLTLVSGTIIKVEEENAFIYFTCNNCKSEKVEQGGDGHVDCASCGQKSNSVSRGYFLEVWLDCGPDLQQTYVKVKLHHRTIKKLLLTYCGTQEEKYSATSLLGHKIGPMACVMLQLERTRHSSISTYSLAELSY